MFERALIVDSHVSSRRGLAHDVSEYGIAHSVIEAESIRDGLRQIHEIPFGACFLGAKLQPSTAIGFIEEARATPLQERCAFLLVTDRENSKLETVRNLADGLIELPYSKSTFTETVTQAFEKRVDPELRRKLEAQNSLSFALEKLAADLREIADGLTTGKFKLQSDGTPAANTEYAFRRAIEQLIPERSSTSELLPQEDDFLRLISSWLTKRVHNSHRAILADLRKHLG